MSDKSVIDWISVQLMEGTIKQILDSQSLVTGKSWVIDWSDPIDKCRLYPKGMSSCSFFSAFVNGRGQPCVDHVADSLGLVLYRVGIDYHVERSVPFGSNNGSCYIQMISFREFTKGYREDWRHYIKIMEMSGKSWLYE